MCLLFLFLAFLVLCCIVWWLKKSERPLLDVDAWLKEHKDRKNKLKLVGIVNPVGGTENGPKIGKILIDVCQKLGFELKIILTKYKGHASDIVAALTPDDCDICVSVGGDGMLNEIINGMLSTPSRVPLAILPSGTGNGVASSLGTNTISSALRAILLAKKKPIDLLQVQVGGAFKMYAAISVSWGLIADIDKLSETSWRWIGSARTTLAAVYTMLFNRTYHGKIEFMIAPNEKTPKVSNDTRIQTKSDGWSVVEGEFSLVTISNLPWLASDILLAPQCELSDGTMTLIFINKASRYSLLKMFIQAETGQHVSNPVVNMIKCTQVRILPKSCTRGSVVADGEIAPVGPIHVTCKPKAVEMCL